MEFDYFKLYGMYAWHIQKQELFEVNEVYIERSVISISNHENDTFEESEDNLILIPQEEVKKFLKSNKIRGAVL